MRVFAVLGLSKFLDVAYPNARLAIFGAEKVFMAYYQCLKRALLVCPSSVVENKECFPLARPIVARYLEEQLHRSQVSRWLWTGAEWMLNRRRCVQDSYCLLVHFHLGQLSVQ